MDTQQILRDVNDAGFCVAEGVCADDLHDIAASLGEVRMDPRSPEPIREIRPQPSSEAKLNTLSSRYGMGPFPFHTDVAHWPSPARLVILYCEEPGSGARPTLLLDPRNWNLGEVERRALTREIWKAGHFRPHLCTVGTMVRDRLAIRFDEGCMVPMTSAASDLKRRILKYLSVSSVTYVHWVRRQMLVMDNHRLLHARGMAHRQDPDRIIKRVLVGG